MHGEGKKLDSSQRPWKRSYRCNVDLLVYLRERKGWTQHVLAEKSGYSERLISKVESGRPISRAAIEILAETLSTDDDRIYLEDLISDNVALAKEYVNAIYVHQKHAFEKIRHFLDDDVVFRVAGDPAVIPFAGEHRGLAEVERMVGVFFSVLQAPANHDHTACYSYLAQGKDVIVWGQSWLHPIGVPLKQPMMISNRMTFQRGKMIRFEDVYDTLHGAQVLRDSANALAANPVDEKQASPQQDASS